MEALDELSSAVMRYLIDRPATEKWPAKPDEVVVTSNDRPMGSGAIAVKHINLFDDTGTGRFGPYINQHTNIPDPKGKEQGYYRNLHRQFELAQHYGFKLCVLDNIACEHFEQFDVKRAIDLALTYKIGVLLRNVGSIKYDVAPLLEHYNVFGMIEDNTSSPQVMDNMRKSVKRDLMPVWYVGHNDLDALNSVVATIQTHKLLYMSVTYSLSGTYTDSVDLLKPLILNKVGG